MAIGGLIVYVACFAFGLGPIFWLLISEVYPLNNRGIAMSAVTVTNWAMNLMEAVTFLSLVAVLGHAGTFWLYGLVAIGAWIFFYKLMPETREKPWSRSKRTGGSAKLHDSSEDKEPSRMQHLQFSCSLWEEATALPHFLEHTIGSGHAPLALRGDWQQQLLDCRAQLGFRHIRFLGLLCDNETGRTVMPHNGSRLAEPCRETPSMTNPCRTG